MLLTFMKCKKQFLTAMFLLLLGACKQSEFYDKSAVLGPKSSAESGTDLPTDQPSSTSGTITGAVSGSISGTETGIILNSRRESFVQNSFKDGDVDILWMIDNSGSMANKQKRLSDSLEVFINKFLDKKINFKMAITTTDGTLAYNGKMIGDSSKLTSTYLNAVGKENFMTYFKSIVKVGISGSGTEQGLKTSASFFDRYASSFLRTDANLAIVEISDEEDQSEKIPSFYLDKIYALKANKGMVKFYSVVTKVLPDDHTLPDSIGNRYIEVATITGGISSEIKNDFSTILLDIGTSIVNLIDSFPIAEAPYNNAVKVFVNNAEVKVGWTYDLNSHSVKFNTGAIPAQGSLIEINYQVKAAVLGAI